jgi:hypothetical protein
MMNRYLLLRRNEEFGPYTLEEIKAFGLLPSDLVWMDNAQRWIHPAETDELRPYVHDEVHFSSSLLCTIPGPSRSQESRIADRFPCRPEVNPITKKKSVQSIPQFRENYREWKPARKKVRRSLDSISDMMKVAIVFLGVLAGSVFLKKLVDGFDNSYEPAGSPISNVKPVMEHESLEKSRSKDLAIAVTKSSKNKESSLLENQVTITIGEDKNSGRAQNGQMKLTVSNHSQNNFDKIIISVDFLQKNGVLLKSEQLEIFSLSPHGVKTLSLVGYTPGTEIKYRIVSIDTKQQNARLRQA